MPQKGHVAHAFTGELITLLAIPTVIHCDNQSTIALSKDGQHHMWMMHIDVHVHFIHKATKSGTISLIYCPTAGLSTTNPWARERADATTMQFIARQMDESIEFRKSLIHKFARSPRAEQQGRF